MKKDIPDSRDRLPVICSKGPSIPVSTTRPRGDFFVGGGIPTVVDGPRSDSAYGRPVSVPPKSAVSRPKRSRVWWLAWLTIAYGLVLLNRFVKTPELGQVNGQLLPCPDSPNCVCSHDTEPASRIEPLACPGPDTPTQELNRLRELVLSLPRTRLVEERPDYLRFEVTTALLRFRDDLEFAADDSKKVIQVRSASRIGRSDLGTNRRRVEAIRALFTPASSGRP